eukprot:TRINITY_DN4585_c0_g1_i2.p1 TRINITY_DN4585_c0_g1~~TRINITY_DN4585_c0_g1_i2.p1  ORF type:complete len:180 (+),score=30.32 TRINITY_DN4585_c0_g1_i2:80-541(+)
MQSVLNEEEKKCFQEAVEQARKSLNEGGIPIGSVLVLDGKIVGAGHNQRVQKGSPILHGEMDAFANAGRLTAAEYRRSTLYTTLSPCPMCTGTALLYGIPHIIIGENKTFQGPEAYLQQNGVKLTILQDQECIDMMEKFIQEKPTLWNEDIGV